MSNTQEIKISVPEGKKAVYDETTQSIKFVDTEPVRSKSWKEFCEKHESIKDEYFVTDYSDIQKITNDYCIRSTESDANLLETKEDAEGILALIQLKRLHDEWVSESDHRDFAVVRDKGDNITIECHALERECKFLSFPTIEMATEFMICFKDLIVTAKMFL